MLQNKISHNLKNLINLKIKINKPFTSIKSCKMNYSRQCNKLWWTVFISYLEPLPLTRKQKDSFKTKLILLVKCISVSLIFLNNLLWKFLNKYLPCKILMKTQANLSKQIKLKNPQNNSKNKLRSSWISALKFMSLFPNLKEIIILY